MNVCVSGYFDPLHVGHLEYIQRAKKMAENTGKLIVIVNNDMQAKLKKGKPFMAQEERLSIVAALRDVDEAVLSIDQDRTVCQTLEWVHQKWPLSVFANGGDQFNHTIPETKICENLGIRLVDSLGNKIQSSSWLTGRSERPGPQT